jgi:hypothetical protein
MAKRKARREPEARPMIILLDLNYTLVANSRDTFSRELPYEKRIEQETYREALIEMIKPHYVVLVTIRDKKYQKQTLERISTLTHWLPHECHFAPQPMSPPDWKEQVLKKLLARMDKNPAHYLAIESNEDNVKMYQRHGVLCLKVHGGQHSTRRKPQSTLW